MSIELDVINRFIECRVFRLSSLAILMSFNKDEFKKVSIELRVLQEIVKEIESSKKIVFTSKAIETIEAAKQFTENLNPNLKEVPQIVLPKLTTAQRFKIADDKATQRTGIKDRLKDYADFWLDIARAKHISYAKQMQEKYSKK